MFSIQPQNLYANTVLGGFVCLLVRNRNHFPVVQFKTKHIFGIPMALRKSLKLFGALQGPYFFFIAAEGSGSPHPIWGTRGATIFFIFSFTTAEGSGFQNGCRRLPRGCAPPETEANDAEGGCVASMYICIFMDTYILQYDLIESNPTEKQGLAP